MEGDPCYLSVEVRTPTFFWPCVVTCFFPPLCYLNFQNQLNESADFWSWSDSVSRGPTGLNESTLKRLAAIGSEQRREWRSPPPILPLLLMKSEGSVVQRWALTSCHECSSPSDSANTAAMTGLLGHINLPCNRPRPLTSEVKSANPDLDGVAASITIWRGGDDAAFTPSIYMSAEHMQVRWRLRPPASRERVFLQIHFTRPTWNEPRESVCWVVPADWATLQLF